MWPPAAEALVRKLLSQPELYISSLREDGERLAAFPLGQSLHSAWFLRPNGDVVSIGENVDNPNEVRVYTDRGNRLSALTWLSRRHAEALSLLPEREADAGDCSCVRIPLSVFGNLICPTCGGLGWLPASSKAESDNSAGCQPPCPSSNRTEINVLERRRRRSRWIGRLTLCFLLLLVSMIFICMVLFRSFTLSHDEVRAIVNSFPGRLATAEEAQRLLGKPLNTQANGGNDKVWRHHMQSPNDMVWQFSRSEFNQVEILFVIGMPDGKGKLSFIKSAGAGFDGWDAWKWRWTELKDRMGIR